MACFSLFIGLALPMRAQKGATPYRERPFPVSGGVLLGLYFENNSVPGSTSTDITLSGGAYIETTRLRFNPGLEYRVQNDESTVFGPLAGARVSTHFSAVHPYAAALFGANHAYTNREFASAEERSGVTSKVLVGVDVDVSPHVRIRLGEFSQGFFTGIPGSQPRAFTTGVVWHLP